MKARNILFGASLVVFQGITAWSRPIDGLSYVYPLPDSRNVSPYTTLIVKGPANKIRQIIHMEGFFNITGSLSGRCTGTVLDSDDLNTCIFRPDKAFEPAEKVTVHLGTNLWGKEGFSYSFQIKDQMDESENLQDRDHWVRMNETQPLMKENAVNVIGQPAVINGVAVPSDFPVIEMSTYGTTAPGKILCGTIFNLSGNNLYLLMLNNDGSPYFYKRGGGWLDKDFAVQPSGDLTVCVDRNGPVYIVMDQTFTEIGSYRCGHGYETDSHDFLLMPDGHAFMIGLESVKVDLSQIVPGGRVNATAIASLVQELDQNKNIIFEWRTMDHMRVEDCVFEDLTQPTIDASHLNSVALDYDGQLLISQKTQSEVSKIDRQTGEFIWRLGGVHNQFTFINENIPISYQHHLRPVPGKPDYYTILDNGNSRNPQFTRAVEYKIDPVAMTAEKVWEYRFPPDGLYTEMMGSVQVLPNGNRLIDGSGFTYTYADEINENDELMQHLYINGISSYRTTRYEWDGVAATPDLFVESDNEKVILGMNKFGDTHVDHFNIYHGLSNPPAELLTTSTEPLCEIRNIENQTIHYFCITAVGEDGTESPSSAVVSVETDFYTLSGNMVQNPSFDDTGHWILECTEDAEAEGSFENGTCHIGINNAGEQTKNIQLIQQGLMIEAGKRYRIEVDAYAFSMRSISLRIEKSISPFTSYGRTNFSLYPSMKHFSYDFERIKESDPDARLNIQCGKYDPDIFLDHVSLREIVPTRVEKVFKPLPQTCFLNHNFPNPFNAGTRIRFSLSKTLHVRLAVSNLKGEEICVLENARKEPGEYSVHWDGQNGSHRPLPSGVYVCTLQSGESRQAMKMLLLK